MMGISQKKKTKIVKLKVLSSEEVKTFQIELPSGVSRITAITVTSSL